MPTKSVKKRGGTYKKTKSKTKKARSRVKYPALDTNYVLMIRRDATDYDYIDKLTDKEKEFLNTFSEEFIGAKFNHGKKILNKKDKHKKSCYSNNNARNRCVYSKAIAQNLITDDYQMPEVDYELQKDTYEDYLIELMDAKNNGWDGTDEGNKD